VVNACGVVLDDSFSEVCGVGSHGLVCAYVNQYARRCTEVAYVEGTVTLGLQIRNITELIQQLERGLEPTAATSLAKRLCLPLDEFVAQFGISSRLLKISLKNKTRLSRDKSQVFYRIGRIFEQALKVFHGDEEKAARWMTTPKYGLNNATPLRFARTEVGGECVLDLLEELVLGGVA
jgi:putative toxin-antitoxin system antitoxin component (TIGR02293 family)